MGPICALLFTLEDYCYSNNDRYSDIIIYNDVALQIFEDLRKKAFGLVLSIMLVFF